MIPVVPLQLKRKQPKLHIIFYRTSQAPAILFFYYRITLLVEILCNINKAYIISFCASICQSICLSVCLQFLFFHNLSLISLNHSNFFLHIIRIDQSLLVFMIFIFFHPLLLNSVQPILAILFKPFGFIASKTLNYLTFQSFNFERT